MQPAAVRFLYGVHELAGVNPTFPVPPEPLCVYLCRQQPAASAAPAPAPALARKQDLFIHYADAKCSQCGAKPEHPSLCLLTGRLLCHWWKGCVDSFGGGLLHAHERCGGTTLLLSLKSTRVMALRGGRLAVCQSPYLDAYGERLGWGGAGRGGLLVVLRAAACQLLLPQLVSREGGPGVQQQHAREVAIPSGCWVLGAGWDGRWAS